MGDVEDIFKNPDLDFLHAYQYESATPEQRGNPLNTYGYAPEDPDTNFLYPPDVPSSSTFPQRIECLPNCHMGARNQSSQPQRDLASYFPPFEDEGPIPGSSTSHPNTFSNCSYHNACLPHTTLGPPTPYGLQYPPTGFQAPFYYGINTSGCNWNSYTSLSDLQQHSIMVSAPPRMGTPMDKVPPRPQVGSEAITLVALLNRKSKPKYFCEVPGCTSQGFTSRHAFEYHQRSHQNIKPFKCVDCSRGFGSRSDLARHRKQLRGCCVRSYNC